MPYNEVICVWVSVREYAKLHDWHEGTIRRKVQRGEFKTAHLRDGHYVIDSEEPCRRKKPRRDKPLNPPHNHLCHDCGVVLWATTKCPETEDHRVGGRCDECFHKKWTVID